MEPCRDCGGSLASDHRYCPQCGRSTSDELETFGAEPAVADQQLVSRGGRPSGPVIALVAVVAAVALVFVVSGSSGEDGPESDDDATAEDATDEDGADGDPRDDEEASEAGDATTTERPTTTAAGDPSTTSTSVLPEVPPFEGTDGLSLLYGGGNLRRIDLDTGLVIEYEVRGIPVLHSGEWLVLADPNSDRAFSVPLADPDGGTRIPLPAVATWFGSVATSSAEPGSAWFYAPDEGGLRQLHLDLSDGTVLEERPSNESWWYGPPAPPGSLSTTPDGGIFAPTDEGYQRLQAGGLVAANDELMLVTTCDSPSDCSLAWIDQRSGLPVDRPLPPPGEVYLGGALSPGGRVLTLLGQAGPAAFDVDRGEAIDGVANGFPSGLAVSPDERFVAVVSASPVIIDLDSGERFTITFPLRTGGYNQVLLVERPE